MPTQAFGQLAGVSDMSVDDQVLHLRVTGAITPVVRAAAQFDVLDFVSREPSLEEIFLAEYGDAPVVISHGS